MLERKKVLESYLEYLEKELNYSSETIKNYEIDILKFLEYSNNYLKVTKDEVRNFLKILDEEKLSNKTISRKLSSLRSFYNFLVDISYVDYNIFLSILNPKSEKKLPNYLSEEETNLLLSSFNLNNFFEVRNQLLLELIYSCGFRLSEVLSVEIKNINMDTCQIKVVGKGKKERYVCFGDYAKEHINLYLNKYYGLYNKNKDNDYLFINKNGGKLSSSMVEKIIKKARVKAGLKKDISAHSLRHSFATDLLNNGASIDTVRTLLGHSSLATTQIYTHVASDKIKSAYNKAHPRSERND